MAPRTGLQPAEMFDCSHGLNLRRPIGQLQAGECFQAGNVWVPNPGRLALRHIDGSVGAPNQLYAVVDHQVEAMAVHDNGAGSKRLIFAGGDLGGGVSDEATMIDSSGTKLDGDSMTKRSGVTASIASIGLPAGPKSYITQGQGVTEATADTLVPAVWTGSAGVEDVRFLAAWENRMVGAHYFSTGGDNNPSSIRFSDPADPNTWPANNFEQLGPGDGDSISGLVAWREYLYAFKQHKIYVFYGVSTDELGNPRFEFEPIDTGVGCAGHGACVAGRAGVYFLGEDGVYVIAGLNTPVRISDDIGPLFTSEFDATQTPGLWFDKIDDDESSLVRFLEWEGHLFMTNGAPAGKVATVWVYNLERGCWYPWGASANCLGNWAINGDVDYLLYGFSHRVDKTEPMSPNLPDADDGFGASERGTTGPFVEYGGGRHRVLRDMKVYGRGNITVEVYADGDMASALSTETFDIYNNGYSLASGSLYKRLADSVKGTSMAIRVRLNTKHSQVHRVVGYFMPVGDQVTRQTVTGAQR